MLTGFLPATSGDALLYGLSIRSDLESVRRSVGICPQYNTHLYDALTVREHLELYADLKYIADGEVKAHIDQLILDVGLQEKEHDVSAALSGGMKRKLCLAIALLGDSKVVFLDEPTSGMDPYSRRSTWELLRQKKAGRVIVLTTHFMDEAEVLGDRIAIMARGELQCCGSPLFLKNLYGVGYTLTICTTQSFDAMRVLQLLTSFIPGVQPLSQNGSEHSFRLPFRSVAHFADVFDSFDRDQEELGIITYGISVTTLEEVFLSVDDHHDEDLTVGKRSRALSLGGGGGDGGGSRSVSDAAQGGSDNSASHDADYASVQIDASSSDPSAAVNMMTLRPVLLTGWKKFRCHVRALLWKRFLHARRDRQTQLWTLLYPLIILFLGCGVLLPPTTDATQPLLAISPSTLPTPNFLVPVRTSGTPARFTTPVFDAQWTPLGAAYTPSSGAANVTDAVLREQTQLWLLDSISPSAHQSYSRFIALDSSLQSDSAGSYTSQSTVYFNTSAEWSSLLGVNVDSNALLHAITGSSAASIHVNLHPLPTLKGASVTSVTNALSAIVITIAMAFVPAAFIIYSLREDELHFRHQQQLSGVQPLSYWTANFLFDLSNFMVIALLAMLVFRIWSINEFLGSGAGAVFVNMLLYALSGIPFTYLIGTMYHSSSSAQTGMLVIAVFLGGLLVLCMLVFSFFEGMSQGVFWAKMGLRIFPPFAFGDVFTNLLVKSSTLAFRSPKETWDIEIGQCRSCDHARFAANVGVIAWEQDVALAQPSSHITFC
jgi:ATP-binding cassette subfamily A (ABC1) protein 3